jgi:hypothetical protein
VDVGRQFGLQLIGAASCREAFLGFVPEVHVLFAISPAEANDSAIDSAGKIDYARRPVAKLHAYGGQFFLAGLKAIDALDEAISQQVSLAGRPAGQGRFERLVQVQHARIVRDDIGHDSAHQDKRFVGLGRGKEVAPVVKAALVFAS